MADEHCLAPWTHTYLSPQSERRMCCASREPAQNFTQYIDAGEASGPYQPQTLEEHWNNDHMRSVRRRMMAGETLPECEVCNYKLLNTSVYRDYFNHMFAGKREELLRATDIDGYHNGLPISFDYRIKNVCTFKCRMCGPMLSSAWEAEERKHNPMFEANNPWAVGENRRAIRKFQQEVAMPELWAAIKERRISEIYWVGGEPLDWPEHWGMMAYMVDNDIAKDVYVRYNTNLHKIEHDGIKLYDLLKHFKDWQICASMDGLRQVAEYIRTGLDFDKWHDNFQKGRAAAISPRQMRMDLTLTLPGLTQVEQIASYAHSCQTKILTKVIFAFTPDIILSPLSLPRPLLEAVINDALQNHYVQNQKDLNDVLSNLLTRPTFQEQWPNDYVYELWKGKARILELESRRKLSYTMRDILKKDQRILEWWDAI